MVLFSLCRFKQRPTRDYQKRSNKQFECFDAVLGGRLTDDAILNYYVILRGMYLDDFDVTSLQG
jgi:hypothetical protein